MKAYYAALLQRQQEAAQMAASAANGNMSTPGDSTVGDGTSEALAAQEMKMDGAEDEEEVEWEDATATGMLGSKPYLPHIYLLQTLTGPIRLLVFVKAKLGKRCSCS